ncbi:MAG: DUF3084 domain-containing protein [Pyramidobacter sp.]|jgi:uncharacterized protein (DUF3084 family)
METGFWELISEVNWKLIILILLISGGLSIVGDRVGLRFAKRRVTLFNLRPRYTSSILTAFTGMVISLVVIIILSMLSESVRTGLFSMQYIQRQLVDLTRQLQDSRNEQQVSSLLIVQAQQELDGKEKELDGKKKELQHREIELKELQNRADELRRSTDQVKTERDNLVAEREKLEKDVGRLRDSLGRLQEGRIVAFSDERLGQEVIPEGTVTQEAAQRCLERLNERVRYEVARRSNVDPASIVLKPDNDSLQNTLNRILAYDSRKVVRAMAPSNIAAGEPVQVVYRVHESSLVFSRGERLLSRIVRQKLTAEQAEAALGSMLRELNRMSQASGILNDPLTGTVGGIAANDFYDAVDRMAAAKAPLRVVLTAERDVYSEGPVGVKIVVQSDVKDMDAYDDELLGPEDLVPLPLANPPSQSDRSAPQGTSKPQR